MPIRFEISLPNLCPFFLNYNDMCPFSHVWCFVTPRTVAHQAPLSMAFSKQEYRSGLLCPPPVDLPYPGIKPTPVYVSCIGRRILYHQCSLGRCIIMIGRNEILLWNRLLSCLNQLSSVTQLHPTLCDPMDYSMPGFPVLHHLPELAQTHVHRVGDAIQPSHPLSFPSPPAFNLSQHQSLFQWVSSSHQAAEVLEFQLLHRSF